MERIRAIETHEKPHPRLVEYMSSDAEFVAEWKPHRSSFGPILEQLPVALSLLRNTTQVSQKSAKRKKTEEPDNTSRFAKIREKKDVFLPCHYFDYIGGTSTGGFVCFPCAPSFVPQGQAVVHSYAELEG